MARTPAGVRRRAMWGIESYVRRTVNPVPARASMSALDALPIDDRWAARRSGVRAPSGVNTTGRPIERSTCPRSVAVARARSRSPVDGRRLVRSTVLNDSFGPAGAGAGLVCARAGASGSSRAMPSMPARAPTVRARRARTPITALLSYAGCGGQARHMDLAPSAPGSASGGRLTRHLRSVRAQPRRAAAPAHGGRGPALRGIGGRSGFAGHVHEGEDRLRGRATGGHLDVSLSGVRGTAEQCGAGDG